MQYFVIIVICTEHCEIQIDGDFIWVSGNFRNFTKRCGESVDYDNANVHATFTFVQPILLLQSNIWYFATATNCSYCMICTRIVLLCLKVQDALDAL